MSDGLQFSVNVDGPLAVYTQIENQLMFAIASGRLTEGEAIPSGRDMSEMVSVNPNTVNKAYRDLEIMGLLRTRRGVGVMVAAGAKQIALRKTLPMVAEHLRDAVAECLACGMKSSDITTAVAKAIKSGVSPYVGAS
ncbi:MAG: GntR family transcriptional regulator [Candidatus Hydrogenedentales bacterium]|jgi:GntR family transcriptional regulator